MYYSKIIDDFRCEIQQVKTQADGIIKQANMACLICNRWLNKLKKAILEDPPKTKEEEIYFFKKVKPIFMCELLFYSEARTLELALAKHSEKFQKDTILARLKFLDNFLLDHAEFCKYMILQGESLDELYFTRSKDTPIIPHALSGFYHDPEFNTSHDRLLAYVQAASKSTEYLRIRLAQVEQKMKPAPAVLNTSLIKWTASKAALAELIYALHYSQSIDHGKGSINKIAEAFQVFFDFDVGQVYQIFSEIKMRQKSKTKFLEELIHTMNSEIHKSER